MIFIRNLQHRWQWQEVHYARISGVELLFFIECGIDRRGFACRHG